MEKDDKIQQRQAKTRQYGWMVVLTVLCVGGLYMVYNTDNFKPEVSQHQTGLDAKFLQQKNSMTTRQLKQPPAEGESIAELVKQYSELDGRVRDLKKRVAIMESDPECIKTTGKLQDVARKLIVAKYGEPPYRVKVELEFPPTIPDYAENGKDGTIVIEMAPIDLIPVSVWTFLEVSRTFKSGSFHRNAGHVLQVQVQSGAIKRHLPFQEYSDKFPHKKGTTGYCGRPSGPCWYVSIQDNTINHGPGSQQAKNPYEADANFGTVVEGFDDVVPRIHTIPQKEWLDAKNQIKIISKTVLISDGQGGFTPWMDNGDVAATA